MIVLGIDAAWTAKNPSGLALISVSDAGKPSVLALARSYDEFLTQRSGTMIDWGTTVTVGLPQIANISSRALEVGGQPLDLIAIDMPLSPKPITGRRVADNEVTRRYGSRWAGIHTPSVERPGPIANNLFADLRSNGYTWLHDHVAEPTTPAFIEVYPHIAIIEMLGLPVRLAYKVEKQYKFPTAVTPQERPASLLGNLLLLRDGLIERIDGLEPLLLPPSDLAGLGITALKGYEDVLDALVSAWMGCEVIAGCAVAYGDADGAIWGPAPNAQFDSQGATRPRLQLG